MSTCHGKAILNQGRSQSWLFWKGTKARTPNWSRGTIHSWLKQERYQAGSHELTWNPLNSYDRQESCLTFKIMVNDISISEPAKKRGNVSKAT